MAKRDPEPAISTNPNTPLVVDKSQWGRRNPAPQRKLKKSTSASRAGPAPRARSAGDRAGPALKLGDTGRAQARGCQLYGLEPARPLVYGGVKSPERELNPPSSVVMLEPYSSGTAARSVGSVKSHLCHLAPLRATAFPLDAIRPRPRQAAGVSMLSKHRITSGPAPRKPRAGPTLSLTQRDRFVRRRILNFGGGMCKRAAAVTIPTKTIRAVEMMQMKGCRVPAPSNCGGKMKRLLPAHAMLR